MGLPFRLLNAFRLLKRSNLYGTSYASSVRCIKTGNEGTGTGSKSSQHDYVPPAVPHGGNADIYLRRGLIRRPEGAKTVEEFKNPLGDDKNWISYGCDPISKKHDRYELHYYVATSIILLFVWGQIIFRYYKPDFAPANLLSGTAIVWSRDPYDYWLMRESYLELERREKLGLPLVDPDYIPREKMLAQLPSEEEIQLYDYDIYV